MKKLISQWTPKAYTFTCDTCNSVYESDEYKIVTIPATKDNEVQIRYHDKCVNCKSRVIVDPMK